MSGKVGEIFVYKSLGGKAVANDLKNLPAPLDRTKLTQGLRIVKQFVRKLLSQLRIRGIVIPWSSAYRAPLHLCDDSLSCDLGAPKRALHQILREVPPRRSKRVAIRSRAALAVYRRLSIVRSHKT
jgi:hypothetical protein